MKSVDCSNIFAKFFDKIQNFFKKDEVNNQKEENIFGSNDFEKYAKDRFDKNDESLFAITSDVAKNLEINKGEIRYVGDEKLGEAEEFVEFIGEILDDEKFLARYDADENGLANTSELQDFFDKVGEHDNNKSNISIDDLIKASKYASLKPAQPSLTGGVGREDVLASINETKSIEDDKLPEEQEPSIDEQIKNNQIPDKLSMSLDEKLGNGFCAKVEDMAQRYNFNPNDLLAIMYLESNLDPTTRNESNGAAGLIQFVSDTASRLDTTTDELANKSAIDQLDYVEEYFKRNIEWKKDVLPNPLDMASLYSLVFLPQYCENYVLCERDNPETAKYYNNNSKMDANEDGVITKDDTLVRLNEKYDELLSVYNLKR